MAELKKIETPRGSLEWVTITGEGKANLSGTLQYLANIVLEGADAEALEQQLRDYWEEHKPKDIGKKLPKSLGVYQHTVKGADGEKVETGKKVFAFKTGITYKSGDPKVVAVYNSKGQKVSLGQKKIGNGSIGRIAGAMGIYENRGPKGILVDAGVTLYLDAIKLLKLVEFSAGSGFSTDDEDFEGGFESVDEPFGGVDESSVDEAPKPRL
jgi:hypothetical protein